MRVPVWLVRLLSLIKRKRLEGELADEIAAHLEEAEQEYLQAGMTPEEARRAALRTFGGVEQVKEHYRDQRGAPWLETLWQDLRYGVRSLVRSPGFTTIALFSLAIGIGANTAIFSLFEQIMLRTLPVHNPEELVYLYSEGPWQGHMSGDEDGGPSFSYPLFRALQEEQTPFTGLAAARRQTASLAFQGQASYGDVRLVSGNYFSLLGVGPTLGRVIGEDDDREPGAHPVAVLGYRYWESRFGADVGVLNKTILINNSPLTIIGVVAREFTSERAGMAPDVYVPVSMFEAIDVSSESLTNRKYAWLTLVGRLKAGVSIARAEAEINVPYRAQVEQDVQLLDQPKPDFLAHFRARTIRLEPGLRGRGNVREYAKDPLALMMGLTLLVLLLACANVANLQLARGAARLHDAAVRLAIGASRWRLVRLFLIESWTLAVAGGLLGLAVAYGMSKAILAAIPAWMDLRDYVSPNLDIWALLYCLGLCWAVGLAFGLFPALKVSGVSVTGSLKDQAGQRSLPRSANAFRKTLVAGQVAVTVLLLIASGLFLATLANVTRIELGIRTDHLATFGLFPRMNRYDAVQTAELNRRLTERLRAIPGVALVSSAQTGAVNGNTNQDGISIEGHDGETVPVHLNAIGNEYFPTMGIPLVSGRDFEPGDNEQAAKVVIVNEAFVHKYLPGRDALGATIEHNREPWRIVGVVKDAAYAAMREELPPTFYLPLRQAGGSGSLYFYLRTAVPPEGLLEVISREVAAVDPALPILELKTMEMQLEENMHAERILSTLTTTLAALATMLAVVGLYGVLAFHVARRKREFGIRMALGAESRHVRGLVVREAGIVVFAGTVFGLAAAAAAGQLIRSALYGLEPWDAPTYFAAVAVVWIAAWGAAYFPARRASRVEPVVALRHE